MEIRYIKELATMAITQCRERLILLIKEVGYITDICIPMVVNVENFIKPDYKEIRHIVRIDCGKLYWKECDEATDVSTLSIDELYEIIRFLK